MSVRLIDSLRTMALPIDGLVGASRFSFSMFVLRIALGSLLSLRFIVDSSFVAESGMFLVDQGKNTKNSEQLVLDGWCCCT